MDNIFLRPEFIERLLTIAVRSLKQGHEGIHQRARRVARGVRQLFLRTSVRSVLITF